MSKRSTVMLIVFAVVAILMLTLAWRPSALADSTSGASWGISGYTTRASNGAEFGGSFTTDDMSLGTYTYGQLNCVPNGTYWLCYIPGGTCKIVNPVTASCSCPAGFTVALTSNYLEYPGEFGTRGYTFTCYK